jgi:hypothetical protein
MGQVDKEVDRSRRTGESIREDGYEILGRNRGKFWTNSVCWLL